MAGSAGGTVQISDKEAFTVLNLPLGVDKEAITKRFKSLSIKLSASRLQEDRKRLEMVVAAYRQLLPPVPKVTNRHRSRHKGNSKSVNDDIDSDGAGSENDWRVLCRNGDPRTNLSQGAVDLTAEERERRKVERRRARNKKRKEKKKLEKMEKILTLKREGDTSSSEEEEEEEEEEDEGEEEEGEEQGLDPHSAFVAHVAARWGGGGQGARQGERGPRPAPAATPNPAPPRPDSRERMEQGENGSIATACQLAKRGNEAANVGQYVAAVKLFSDAIALDQTDHRFLGNRSFCFNQLGYHDSALQDAERAITLAPNWAKGHFRRATALRDLGRLVEAEAAFEEVLRLDDTCTEAHLEINRIMMARIVEMGFSETQAVDAVAKYAAVQPALDALLAGQFQESTEDVFYSDEEEEFKPRGNTNRGKTKDFKMNPQNPEGLTSLWIGNVLPEVTEKSVSQLFSKYGQVTSVRLLREKYCGFVNFSDKMAAGRAMEELQGREFCGQKLLIKFPDNPIVPHPAAVAAAAAAAAGGAAGGGGGGGSGGGGGRRLRQHINAFVAKNTTNGTTTTTNGTTTTTATTTTTTATTTLDKLKGPVNGSECYFWRTTGCAFGSNCKHQHVLKNRGVDRRPWQKQQ